MRSHHSNEQCAVPIQDEPLLFSASDDRSVRAWDVLTHNCVKTLTPPNRKCGTMRSLVCTEEHLFIGSSNGVLYVYCINGLSRLTHHKHRRRIMEQANARAGKKGAAAVEPDEDETRFEFTLETQIEHGEEPLNSLAVGGPGGYKDFLFSASQDGSVWVWSIPEDDLNFQVMQKIQPHTLTICSIVVTPSYLLSASDDGSLRVYALQHGLGDSDEVLFFERSLKVGARIKCLSFTPDENGHGYMLLGLNIGDCITAPIGITI